jgi:hypothetical protein
VSRGLALAALALGVSGAAASPADVWTKLRRPLRVPRLAPGARCPVSALEAGFNFRKYGVAPGIGRGPAYPIFGLPDSVLQFVYPPPANSEFAGSTWSGNKVLWFVAPSYRGPVLIRGRRLDAPGLVRFERGKLPPAELRIAPGFSLVGNPGVKYVGQRYHPSYTRLRAPGCYAYQIDGTTFSHIVVFQARLYP